MKISNICPHCGRYIYKYGDGKGKFRYSTRKFYKDLWRQQTGDYRLGKFYKSRCPVCNRHLAVFEDVKGEPFESRGPVVLYLCTLSDSPFDAERCASVKSCHLCGILKEQREAGFALWYKKQNLLTKT